MKAQRTRKPWTARRIHLWIAVAVAIPMLLVALSGILISMRSITRIQVPSSWTGAERTPDRLPTIAYLEGPGEARWIGNAQGLWRIDGTTARAIDAFDGQEVIALAARPGHDEPVVATRMAVWTLAEGGQWKAMLRGRVRQLASLADGRVLAIAGGRGEMAAGRPMVSADGIQWTPYGPAMKAARALPPLENPTVPLHHFMRELHSGAYFVGKGPGEIAWSGVLGGVLGTLTLTGLWMWLRTERRRAAERRAASSPAGTPSLQTSLSRSA